MTKLKQIEQSIENFSDTVNNGVSENMEIEYMDQYHNMGYTTYSVTSDVEDFLFKIGIILDEKILIDGFKKPKTEAFLAK